MNPRLTIRPARLADAPALAAAMRAAIQAVPPGAHPAPALAAWARLPPLYHRWAMGPGGESYRVAERAGRVVGYAARRGPELTALFVRPRAQRTGVGRALVAAIARNARRAGARSLRVDAALGAAPFYRALGFAAGRARRVPLPGGGALGAVRMTLPLRPAGIRAGRRAGETGSAGSAPTPPGAGRPPPGRGSGPGRRARPASR